jgi:hypothetical protein
MFMKISFRIFLATAFLAVSTVAFAQAHDFDDGGVGESRSASQGSAFVLDSQKYPGSTHFIFLEAKTERMTSEYRQNVDRFVRAIASQPGFRASMTLTDIDLKRVVVYYQFESEALWKAARQNPVMYPLAGALQAASKRFDDYATRPLEQIAAGAQQLPQGYAAQFRVGDGVGINEATVVPGRQQFELTRLMRRAGQAANPNGTVGFKDFTFHEAIDGSRNMNLLHWSSVRNMTVAALGPLVQALINGGLTGTTDGWGPTGAGFIGVHVYSITNIQNGRPMQ